MVIRLPNCLAAAPQISIRLAQRQHRNEARISAGLCTAAVLRYDGTRDGELPNAVVTVHECSPRLGQALAEERMLASMPVSESQWIQRLDLLQQKSFFWEAATKYVTMNQDDHWAQLEPLEWCILLGEV